MERLRQLDAELGVGRQRQALLERAKADGVDEAAIRDAGLLERDAFLRPDTLKDTNRLQLFVFANDDAGKAVLVARLDNLGKGASGAAVQNLNLALGLNEDEGLS